MLTEEVAELNEIEAEQQRTKEDTLARLRKARPVVSKRDQLGSKLHLPAFRLHDYPSLRSQIELDLIGKFNLWKHSSY